MRKSIFKFKEFSIDHSNCAMKVGTDGVLLGAWCDIPDKEKLHILDIGTGSGLISLMIAQRSKNTVIDAVEIDSDA